jgi:hypothetical protein
MFMERGSSWSQDLQLAGSIFLAGGSHFTTLKTLVLNLPRPPFSQTPFQAHEVLCISVLV